MQDGTDFVRSCFCADNANDIVSETTKQAGERCSYDFVAVGFSLFYSIFKLHSEYDTGYYALGFVYTKISQCTPTS